MKINKISYTLYKIFFNINFMAKKNLTAKIAAIIALIAIVSSIIWTWILIIYQTHFSKTDNNLTQEQLKELINWYSWGLLDWWEETLTWNTK